MSSKTSQITKARSEALYGFLLKSKRPHDIPGLCQQFRYNFGGNAAVKSAIKNLGQDGRLEFLTNESGMVFIEAKKPKSMAGLVSPSTSKKQDS